MLPASDQTLRSLQTCMLSIGNIQLYSMFQLATVLPVIISGSTVSSAMPYHHHHQHILPIIPPSDTPSHIDVRGNTYCIRTVQKPTCVREAATLGCPYTPLTVAHLPIESPATPTHTQSPPFGLATHHLSSRQLYRCCLSVSGDQQPPPPPRPTLRRAPAGQMPFTSFYAAGAVGAAPGEAVRQSSSAR